MRISARTDYACRALLELALHWPNPTPVQIHSIAQDQKIPVKFLTQILVSLKQAGLVESLRGQKGGYILARSPREITLREVVEHFEKNQRPLGSKGRRADVFAGIWRQIEEDMKKSLEKITLEEITRNDRNLEKVQMFAI